MKHHSERVSGKNYRPLGGKPLLAWIMEALAQSRYIEEIVVNTDSERVIAEVAAFDVTVLRRPEHLLGDMVTMHPLIEWDLQHVAGDYFLQTHSTNPLVKTATIDAAIEAFFAQDEHDSLFSVTPRQTRYYWPDGRPINHDPSNLIRTQDLTPVYEENSCFYLFSRDSYEKRQLRIGEKPLMFEMEALEAIDIDDESDFRIAEALIAAGVAGT